MPHLLKNTFFILFLALTACTSQLPSRETGLIATESLARQDASEIYGELFERVQMAPVFADSKDFVDMIPRESPEKILSSYRLERPQTKEELKNFVDRHFSAPVDPASRFQPKDGEGISSHISRLWDALTRKPDEEAEAAASLIPLPYSYVVPGGRFREIYYWDSYFTQLGLLADGKDEVFRNMVRNFSHLLMTSGRIPNGNRDYYRGRSQPPFFSHMVALWEERFGRESALPFLEALKKEHDFWMDGAQDLKSLPAKNRVVRAGENGILNRYWDDKALPRPEAYKEDRHLAEKAGLQHGRKAGDVYRELRAGAESGWDYSSRWFQDPRDFATIQTTSMAPVDLNALLYHLEMKISKMSESAGDMASSRRYRTLAEERRKLILTLMWDEASGTFQDYNWRTKERSSRISAAATLPLFVGLAEKSQARKLARTIEKNLLRAGGIVTTPIVSGQQWDAPNGWAPHQWTAYAGLRRYGEDALAEKIRARWLKLNRKVFRATGKMMEKYNVVDLSLESGGGEYPLQDGFGWTNGVYRAFETPEKSLRHLFKRKSP